MAFPFNVALSSPFTTSQMENEALLGVDTNRVPLGKNNIDLMGEMGPWSVRQ